MSNATPSRIGQIAATGDTDALFLKVFSGMTMAAFHRAAQFRDKQISRTISSGKSAQFPLSGLAVARYHVPGTEIQGGTLRHGERVITIEDLLIADAFLASIDEAKNHYDARSIYASEIGEAMGRAYDQNVARTGILNARAGANLPELPAGTQLTNASYATDGTVLYNGVFDSGVQLDANDVPPSDRFGFFKPVQYALLVKAEKPINFDLNQGALNNGSIAHGVVRLINDIQLIKTNNLPGADDRANPDIPAIRQADYSVTQGLVQHRSAVGTVGLMDMTTEMTYDPRRLGHLIVGRYAVGHGGLRPEAGIELRSGAPS